MKRARTQRRLAAILAADMVGFSRLMADDEVGTVTAVKRLRSDIIEPLLKRVDGRLIKTTGDGFLFEFGSVFDAFDFAALVQGRDAPGQPLRMGLNLGDIIIDGDDVFGDGVNIAARLEPLSQPGGLMLSRRAWEDLRRLPVVFTDAGALELKNIPDAQQAWSIDQAALRAYAQTLVDDRDDYAVAEPGPAVQHPPSRRNLLLLSGGIAAVAVGGLAYSRFGAGKPTDPPELAALLDQAWQAWAQGSSEGNNQAIGLYRRATTLAPNSADAWGFLGCAYGDRGHSWATHAERGSIWERAKEAGGRSLALDDKNAYGRAAIAYARPLRGNWALMESAFRQGNHDQPGKFLIVYSLALLLGDVGRYREAADLFGSLDRMAPTATQYYFYIEALWSSGQLDMADKELGAANEIYAGNPAIWWLRYSMLLNGGRAAEAISRAEDVDSRPANVSADEIELAIGVARAMVSRAPAEVAAVVDRLLAAAKQGRFTAARAIGQACSLGATDAAFAIAEAMFFSRGFEVPDFKPPAGTSLQVTLDDRRPRVLFVPSARAMWKDPRFGPLLTRLGLETYWKSTNSVPDFRKA